MKKLYYWLKKTKYAKWGKRIVISCLVLGVIGSIVSFALSFYIKNKASEFILTLEEVQEEEKFDCILVLGCGVWNGNVPSPMLSDRLDRSIELYEIGVSDKLLMSGDHGSVDYDEVNVMKNYAIDAGIDSEVIFMDHAGFSTYESMYRAKEIFQAKRILIVTQEYHMYRSIYIARELGMDAWGVSADKRKYAGAIQREVREVLARCKDFFSVIMKKQPTYLGETIPINGNGNITND